MAHTGFSPVRSTFAHLTRDICSDVRTLFDLGLFQPKLFSPVTV